MNNETQKCNCFNECKCDDKKTNFPIVILKGRATVPESIENANSLPIEENFTIIATNISKEMWEFGQKMWKMAGEKVAKFYEGQE